MAKVLDGTYRAKVLPFTFEKVGEKDSPIMKAHFQPIGQVVGTEVKVEEGLPEVNKGYFLSLDIVTKGKYSGKSQIEALKIQLEESYGYTGEFDMGSINGAVPGKEVDIVCAPKEHNGKKFTDVKYVNAPGAKPRKAIKELSPDEIANFAKGWNTSSKTSQPPQDAKSLFAQLTGSAGEKKPDGQ